jgi:hypothetical protein
LGKIGEPGKNASPDSDSIQPMLKSSMASVHHICVAKQAPSGLATQELFARAYLTTISEKRILCAAHNCGYGFQQCEQVAIAQKPPELTEGPIFP